MTFETYLEHALDSVSESRVKKAMQYSLMAPGKRLRPRLVVLTAESCGIEPFKAYPAASALEMIHTYSLIHDDLPAMDDDDLRRGRKTCHVEFDEATAILAGDGLLTEAFAHISRADYSDAIKAQCMKVLAVNAGADGMVLGQILDLTNENNPECTYETLKQIHINKTGRLFSAALQLGAIVAERSDECERLDQIGLLLGLAFQIQDDLLDITSTSEMMGKTIGKDLESHKSTTCSILGIENSRKLLDEVYEQMLKQLGECSFDTAEIKKLFLEMKERIR
ncbi:MAG: polyprenyl synthetase family protein [Erysipelotrichaceae bacterium]|nr:polyprenyl synthetase family protein [Erysipelotrichaceae bacterium]MBQ4343166.1 polyprenyl synthetase family protein [Erysipelotrichaceae bacterium]